MQSKCKIKGEFLYFIAYMGGVLRKLYSTMVAFYMFFIFLQLHMLFYLYVLLGFLGGIPAGMGMGGGTVTIPLLVLIGGVEQKLAQCANLFAFLPMSLFALKTHADNKLLQTKGILWVILPALALSIAGTLLAVALPSELLKKAFGIFLLFLSVVGLRNALQEKG